MLLLISVLTVVLLCAVSGCLVQKARDSRLALNRVLMRKEYKRQVQLYLIVTETASDWQAPYSTDTTSN